METTLGKSIMPLIEAAYEGNTVQVQSFLEEGADVNEKDASGRTALMIAANRGHTYVVQLLLDNGADANLKDNLGNSALQAAESRGFHRIVSLLRKFSHSEEKTESEALSDAVAQRPSLHRAVDDGDFNALKSLISSGADVNARSSDQWTPLMLATIKGHTEMVEALLNNGADSNARNKKGWTALMFAVSMSDAETMLILLKGGANINARDKDGKTALMQAANENNKESVKCLLEAGADVSLEDHAGETALDIARRRGHSEVIDILRQSGAESGSSRPASPAPAGSALDRATVNDLFNEGELERLKKELDELMPETWPDAKAIVPHAAAMPLEVSTKTQAALVRAQVMGLGERLVAALEALREPRHAHEGIAVADIAHKLMLTLSEASALSNLSRSHLREALKRGKLKGKVIGRGWRIKRADLETYVRALI